MVVNISQNELEEFRMRLAEARREASPLLARRDYSMVLEWAKTHVEAGESSSQVVEIASSALADLAAMEADAQKRLKLRYEAITLCRKVLNATFSANTAVSLANRVVDLFYDRFVSKGPLRMQALLADTLRTLERGINFNQNKFTSAELLTQKSSVLRCQGLISARQIQIARISEAVQSAKKASELAPDFYFTYLELGQALWNSARWASADDRYASALNGAERSLFKAQVAHEALPRLVLARFYRQTYRPAESTDKFAEYASLERNTRRLWAESFTYGEAAMQLWYNNYEQSFTNQNLSRARTVLREAIDAGYENARNFIALAFIEAALGDTDIAEQTLRKIAKEGASSWLLIVQEAIEDLSHEEIKPLTQGWALGITDARVWNSLGTYAIEFVGDRELAIQLYEFARRMDPKDPIILTNLARVLIKRGYNEDLAFAEKYLQQAAFYADRGFFWWRNELQKLRTEHGLQKPQKVLIRRPPGDTRVTRKELQATLAGLDGWSGSPSTRGSEFEKLFIDLLRITAGVSNLSPSYQLPRQTGTEHPRQREVDAAFLYSRTDYRVELKWEQRPIGPSMIDSFFSRLRTPGINGLFVSMSGFTEGAIDQAWELLEKEKARIILMDGDEVRKAIAGDLSFEMLLENKERYLSLTGKPYVRIPEAR